ncbi:MAG: hypothetical protein QM756_41655 [Polyangiaceae bacterium]
MPRRRSGRRLAALCAVLGLASSTAWAEARSAKWPTRIRPADLSLDERAWQELGVGAIRGVTIGPIESALHPNRGYGSQAFEASLDEAQQMGANWVSLTPFGRVLDSGANRRRHDLRAAVRGQSPGREARRRAGPCSRSARALGATPVGGERRLARRNRARR